MGIDLGVIEKDYVLGWTLAAIAAEPALADSWIFKGGTCLRKCWYETFRFSEDLDFTIVEGGPDRTRGAPDLRALRDWLPRIAASSSASRTTPSARARTCRGQPDRRRVASPTTARIRAERRRSSSSTSPPTRCSPQRPAPFRGSGTPYGDQPLPVQGVASYRLPELAGEKTRALTQRCCPRDLYDVVHLTATPTCSAEPHTCANCCKSNATRQHPRSPTSPPSTPRLRDRDRGRVGEHARPPTPASPARRSASSGTRPRLSSPGGGSLTAAACRAAQLGNEPRPPDLRRLPARSVLATRITSRDYPLRRRQPTEGGDRLPPLDGRVGPPVVEPTPCGAPREGNLVLFVVNDRRRASQLPSTTASPASVRPRSPSRRAVRG